MTEGTRVRLKSGGPTMTILAADESDAPDDAPCVWISACGERLFAVLKFNAIVCLIGDAEETP